MLRRTSTSSALISVASALSGAQAALTDADVRRAGPKLKEFFAGQRLTSGSSGWLATAYARRGNVDALINYESVLHSLNRDSGTGAFFPEVTVTFAVVPGEHYHVPLLLNPFGYSVYRGS